MKSKSKSNLWHIWMRARDIKPKPSWTLVSGFLSRYEADVQLRNLKLQTRGQFEFKVLPVWQAPKT